MQITINNMPVEVQEGETVLEAALRSGCSIPSLCYAKGAQHRSSCMVCAVGNRANGQIIPSCSTYPVAGMQIDTDGEEVKQVRRLSLELLLSDHKADCEAPCSLVCPEGLDVEKVLGCYDAGDREKACQLIASAFALPGLGCDTCKAPCEKACRRGSIDTPVSIREIIKEIVAQQRGEIPDQQLGEIPAQQLGEIPDLQRGEIPAQQRGEIPAAEEKIAGKENKNTFYSRLGRFTPQEKKRLKETVDTPSRCLHCACAGRARCKLRSAASAERIIRPRYDASTTLPVMNKQSIGGNLWFEQAKCIRCGLCVYNSENGFTFKGRGFGMQVVLPEENRTAIKEELAELCPTGAIYLSDI